MGKAPKRQAGHSRPATQTLRQTFGYSVVLSLLLFLIPSGLLLSVPFQLFATVVHELGHGLMAVLVDADFHAFSLAPDGSGAARISGNSGLGSVLIGAGGLVGPSLLGGLFFVLALRPTTARITLGLLGLGLLAAELTVVSGSFSLFFVGILVALCAVLAVARGNTPQATLIVVGVQLSLSLWWDWNYFFTELGGQSDVAYMSEAVGLPHWMWGSLCVLLSIGALLLGAYTFLCCAPSHVNDTEASCAEHS